MTGTTLGRRPIDAQLYMALMMEIVQRLSRLLTEFTTSVYAVVSKYHASIAPSDKVYKRTTKFHRRSFEDYSVAITDHVFEQMFRMCRQAFARLTKVIKNAIGSCRFKSELEDPNTCFRGINMRAAHEKGSGGYLHGEIKLDHLQRKSCLLAVTNVDFV